MDNGIACYWRVHWPRNPCRLLRVIYAAIACLAFGVVFLATGVGQMMQDHADNMDDEGGWK